MENVTTAEKRAAGRLIFGQIRNRKNMTSVTLFWGAHFVEKSQKMTMKKTSNNGWEKAVHHRT